MELSRLRTFVEIAAAGNLTRAADRLFLSQAAVSSQLKALEDELGLGLFTRTSRGMVLTPAGERLLPMAEDLLKGAALLTAEADKLSGRAPLRLAVGLNTDPEYLRMGALIRVLAEAFPETAVSFVPTTTVRTPERLRDGTIDIGFCFGDEFEPGIAHLDVSTAPVAVAVPASLYPDDSEGEPGWERITALPWIWTCCGCPFHRALGHEMERRGLAPNVCADAVDEYIVRQYLLAGRGAAPLREDHARSLATEGAIRIWEPGAYTVPLSLVWLDSPDKSPVLREAAEALARIWETD